MSPATDRSRCSHKTIPALFAEPARLAANGPRDAAVFVEQDKRFTWDELAETVDALAAGLLALGLKKGDRIGIWSPNRWEWLLTQFATARIGLVLVNINPAYRLTELEYALNKVGCSALITRRPLQDLRLSRHDRDARAGDCASAEPGKLKAGQAAAARDRHPHGRGELAGHVQFRRRDGARPARDEHERLDRDLRGAEAGRRRQHPVHLRHDRRARRARRSRHGNIVNNANFVTAAMQFRAPTTGSAFRCRSTTASAW